MKDEQTRKDQAPSREQRAASVAEHLRAAKAELLSSSPEPAPETALSLRPLLIGVGAIALGAVIWMAVGGGSGTDTAVDTQVLEQPVEEDRASVALEAARQARERVRAAEEAARQARERRAALEAEQAAQRVREEEQARREAEEQAAALAAEQESARRAVLEERQAQARREAAERAAQAERERQAALAAQREQEAAAAREAEVARQAELRREAEVQAQQEREAREREAARQQAEQAATDAAVPAPVVETAPAPATRDPVEAFRQARPGETRGGQTADEAEAEFSADPCKGPSARFLSTCR